MTGPGALNLSDGLGRTGGGGPLSRAYRGHRDVLQKVMATGPEVIADLDRRA